MDLIMVVVSFGVSLLLWEGNLGGPAVRAVY